MNLLFYAETAILCAMVLCILLFRTKILTRNSEHSKPLRVLMVSTIFFSSLDCLGGILITLPDVSSYLAPAFAAISHLSVAVLSFIWLCCTDEFMFGKRNSSLHFEGILPLVAEILLLIINYKTDRFFTLTDDGIIEYNDSSWILFIPIWFYFLYAIIRMHIFEVREEDRHKRHLLIGIMSSGFFPLMGSILQFLNVTKPFISAGFMLGSLLLFSYNVTSEHDYLMKERQKSNDLRHSAIINGLSDDFGCIYYVDLRNGESVNYRVNRLFSPLIPDWESIGNFFERIRLFSKYAVYEKDVDTYLEECSVERIMEDLNQGKPHFINFRVRINGEMRYFQNKVVQNDWCETKYHVVIGCYEITEQIKHEIDEREKAEEILKAEMANQKLLNEAMQKAEEANNAKSRFLFSMSHDLRTPMNAILGFTELAQKNLNNDGMVSDCLNKVSIAGNQLLQLINDVLDMSRIECGRVIIEKSPASLKTIAENFRIMVSDAAEKKNIDLKVNCDGISDDYVYIDTLRLNQVALNIIHNAIKYTPAGGHVNVILKQTSKVIDSYADYSIIVSDNGIGIGKEFQTHIFEAFARERTTTVSKIEGTGLGLAITKNLIDLMGGDINIDSTPGVGTTVTCSFTLETLNEAIETTESNDYEDIDVKGKRILVVEDNELNREIACGILEDFGLTVESADDGSVAVSMFDKCGEHYYDYILMDIQMPFMDGYKATEAIRDIEKDSTDHIPIIALTANAFEDDRRKAFEAGMDAHVSKPINSRLLLRTLRELSEENRSRRR